MNLNRNIFLNLIYLNFICILIVICTQLDGGEAYDQQLLMQNCRAMLNNDPRYSARKRIKPRLRENHEKSASQILSEAFKFTNPFGSMQPPIRPTPRPQPRRVPPRMTDDSTKYLNLGVPRLGSLQSHLKDMKSQQNVIFEGRPSSKTIVPEFRQKVQFASGEDAHFEPQQMIASQRQRNRYKYIPAESSEEDEVEVKIKNKKTDVVHSEQGYDDFENDEGHHKKEKKVRKKKSKSRPKRSSGFLPMPHIRHNFVRNPLVRRYSEPLITFNITEPDFEHKPENKTKLMGGLGDQLDRYKGELFKQNNMEKDFFASKIRNGKFYGEYGLSGIKPHNYFGSVLASAIRTVAMESDENSDEF